MPTGLLLFLTFGLLLSILALSVARGEFLRATDAVTRATDVKVTIAEARISVDERPERARDLFKKLQEMTADNARQQARADALSRDTGDGREARLQLDVMKGDQDALIAVLEADARSKRGLVGIVLLVCTAFALAFAGASAFVVRSGRRDLKQQTALLGSLLDGIGDAVVAVDRDGRCVVANAAFRRVFAVGFGQGQVGIDEALRHGIRRTDGSVLEFAEGPFGLALRGESIDGLDVSLHTDPKAPRVFLSATCRPVRNERGEINSGVVVFRDVTSERSDLELLALQAAELQVQSLSDELTGLYNRRGFTVLSNQYARTALRAKRPFAVLFCDLNGLKTINDTHGHEAGDDAIKRMAAVLRATFRESDIVARLGGDEYVALVDGADESTMPTVLARLREEMDLDAKKHDTPYRLHTSTGAAFQPPEGTATIDELVTLADERMYSEKKTSKESRAGRAEQEVAAREQAVRETKLREARSRLAHAQKVMSTGSHSPAGPPSSSGKVPPRPTPRKT